MYYQEYITGSLLNSSSYWNPNIQSTAASGTLDDDYRYYPTGLGDKITVVAIPRTVFGEQIARKSISFKSNNFNLIDDGNGNIVDAMASYTHVGNVLYSQGIAILTNQDYNYALIEADCDNQGTAFRSFPDNPFFGDGCVTGSIYLMTPGTTNLYSRSFLEGLTPVIEDFRADNFAVPNTPFSQGLPGYPNLTQWFQIKYDGYMNIPDTGTYNFKACSDDGAIFRLFDLNDVQVYNLYNGGQHAYQCANSNVTLTAGTYRFELDYYQGPPIFLGISLFWTRPGGAEQIIPKEYFICYTPDATTTTTTSTTTTTTTVDYVTSTNNFTYTVAVSDSEALSFKAQVTSSTGGKIEYCNIYQYRIPSGDFASSAPSCGTNYGQGGGGPEASLGVLERDTRNYRVGDKLTYIVNYARIDNSIDPEVEVTYANISASISIVRYKTNGDTVLPFPGSQVTVAYYEGIQPDNMISASYIITSTDLETGSYLKFDAIAEAKYNV
jgi:hypothetical protein